jgi:RNA polymerase sigma-70 factor (ECF subfamily)
VSENIRIFEEHRPALIALAYRMLGDLARAEDMVQEAWLRWDGRNESVAIETPKAYLVTVVTRLCLNELDSAHMRREESRSDRLPEPVDLSERGLEAVRAVEGSDRISMAFLVVLQRLTPAERAVLLLHDVFDFSHADIASLVGKSEPACRQLLKRARDNVAAERRSLSTPREEHERLLHAFLAAVRSGDIEGLTRLLVDDAMVIADGGLDGVRVGQVKNLPRPLEGAARIAAFLAAASKRNGPLDTRECVLNGQPALVASRDGKPVVAILLAVADGKIRRVFIHADPTRLGHVGLN